jgi:hypothetical protein
LNSKKEYSSSATYPFDPLPPKNSIVSYTRPPRQSSRFAQTSSQASLLTFFQSLLPNFNLQDANQEADAAGAVGGEGVAQNNPFGMNNMVGRLREFLQAIENQFPAQQQRAEGEHRNQNEDPLPEDYYYDSDDFD